MYTHYLPYFNGLISIMIVTSARLPSPCVSPSWHLVDSERAEI